MGPAFGHGADVAALGVDHHGHGVRHGLDGGGQHVPAAGAESAVEGQVGLVAADEVRRGLHQAAVELQHAGGIAGQAGGQALRHRIEPDAQKRVLGGDGPRQTIGEGAHGETLPESGTVSARARARGPRLQQGVEEVPIHDRSRQAVGDAGGVDPHGSRQAVQDPGRIHNHWLGRRRFRADHEDHPAPGQEVAVQVGQLQARAVVGADHGVGATAAGDARQLHQEGVGRLPPDALAEDGAPQVRLVAGQAVAGGPAPVDVSGGVDDAAPGRRGCAATGSDAGPSPGRRRRAPCTHPRARRRPGSRAPAGPSAAGRRQVRRRGGPRPGRRSPSRGRRTSSRQRPSSSRREPGTTLALSASSSTRARIEPLADMAVPTVVRASTRTLDTASRRPARAAALAARNPVRRCRAGLAPSLSAATPVTVRVPAVQSRRPWSRPPEGAATARVSTTAREVSWAAAALHSSRVTRGRMAICT